MARSRIKTLSKLFLLLGLPVLTLGGIFAGGVYVGVENQRAVVDFETSIFGAGDGGDADPSDVDGSEPGSQSRGPSAAPAVPSADKGPSDPRGPSAVPAAPTPIPAAAPTPTAAPALSPGTAPVAEPAASSDAPPERSHGGTGSEGIAAPVALPSPVPADLKLAFDRRRVVTVKLLVDPMIAEGRSDWMDYCQNLVTAASATYTTLFGIEFRLTGVVQWTVDASRMDPDGLLNDLRTRPREGADVLLAITNRGLEGGIGGRGDLPASTSGENGAYAVILASGRRLPHLRTMLHELGHIFGARDNKDPADSAFVGGSFMSYASAAEDAIPTIGAENRRLILERKGFPFVAAGTARQEGALDGQ